MNTIDSPALMKSVCLGLALAWPAHAADKAPALQWRMGYDDAGRINKLIDPTGQVTTWQRELDGTNRVKRVVKTLADGASVEYDYDERGRPRRLRDTLGAMQYAWAGDHQVTVQRGENGPPVVYEWDAEDRLIRRDVDGFRLNYSVGFLGRLEKITTPLGEVTYQYLLGQGRTIRTLPNGVRTIWEHTPEGTLQSITHVGKSNRILAEFKYACRPDGLISEIQEFSSRRGRRVSHFDYDLVHRLTNVTISPDSASRRFHYDQVGNRIGSVVGNSQPVQSGFDWAGRLWQHDERACTNDAAGNLLSLASESGLRSFTYTAENLLKTAVTPDRRVEYQHDGDGRLVTWTRHGKTTTFVPDVLAGIWQPLLAIDAEGKKTFYVWDGNAPLFVVRDGVVQFFLHDHLGTARAAVSPRSELVQEWDYDAFGAPLTGFDGNDLSPGFGGLFFDPCAQLYLTRHRGYDPRLGRFLQRDPQIRIPFGSQKDLSAYTYCGNDPVNFVDLDGAVPIFYDNWRYYGEAALRSANHCRPAGAPVA